MQVEHGDKSTEQKSDFKDFCVNYKWSLGVPILYAKYDYQYGKITEISQ